MLARLPGGTAPAHVADCYKGLIDALVVDEADADDGRAACRTIVARTLMSDADARRRLAEAVLAVAGARVRVAILGGTGAFGRGARGAPARGRPRGRSIGSRDAEPRAGARRGAGVAGDANAEEVAGADLAVLAVNADAASRRPERWPTRSATTPVLSVASELDFGADGA